MPWRFVLSSFNAEDHTGLDHTGSDSYGTHRSRPRWLVYGLILLALVLVALGARWFAAGGVSKNAKSGRPAAPVAVATVVLADMPETLNAIGTVTPLDTATVQTQLAGNVMAILFKEGQMVTQGQAIVQIDPRPYKLALDQAQGTLARDSATLAMAQLDLKRYETLASQDSIARQTMEDERGTVAQLQGTVMTDRAAVGSARLNLQYTTIRAPFTGRIGLKQVTVGNYVTPSATGSTNGTSSTSGVAVITRIDPIDVEFAVPQAMLSDVQHKVGSGAGLPVTILDQDNTTVLANGTFSTFDNQIATATGTVNAKARVANPVIKAKDGNTSPALFPNQFVNATMLVDTLRQVPIVPVSALRHGPQGDFVFVVQDGKAPADKSQADKSQTGKGDAEQGGHIVKIAIVKTGPSDAKNTAILSGLQKGQIVVSEGADGLDEGSVVRLPGEKGGAAADGKTGKSGSHKKKNAGADSQ